MASHYKARWIIIAGHSKRIKEGVPPPHWRCEIKGEEGRQPITGWTLRGEATNENNTQATNPAAKGDAFLAWVSYFGDITIGDDGHVIIDLLQPPPA